MLLVWNSQCLLEIGLLNVCSQTQRGGEYCNGLMTVVVVGVFKNSVVGK